MRKFIRLILFMLMIFIQHRVWAQGSRLSITYSNPAGLSVCGSEVNASVTVRNISLSQVNGNRLTITMPAGILYVQGSVQGNGVSERNISNLSAPQFNLPNIDVARDVQISFRVKASCDLIPWLNANRQLMFQHRVDYTGNYDLVFTLPFNVAQPNLRIQNISNKFFTGDKGSVFTRTITLINSGQGPVKGFEFYQVNESGLKILGVSGGSLRQSGDTLYSTFDSSHFTSVGNKDKWLDRNEVIEIYDTLQIVQCTPLASRFLLRWGCEGKWCNTSTDQASALITNRAPNLVFSATGGTMTCYGDGSRTSHQLRVINNGNDTARLTRVNIMQSVTGGFWNAMFSRIDTSTIRVSKGVNGAKNRANLENFQFTRNDGDWSCLGNNPVGALDVLLDQVLAGDTFYIAFDQVHCCRSTCNSNAYINGWRYRASYVNQCAAIVNTAEAWGKVYDYTFVSATPFSPTDITDQESKFLTYTFTNFSRAYQNVRSLMKITLVLPKGVGHSGSSNDFRILSVNGTYWNPAQISRNGDTLIGWFRGLPPFDMRQAELKIRIKADCSLSNNAHGLQNYSLNIGYRSDTTCAQSCTYPLYCANATIRVHCINTCNRGGMFFKNFTAERANVGLPDNNNDGLPDTTGLIDEDKIKRERVMVGDTLRTRFSGIVQPAGSIRSWRFGAAVSRIANGNIMQVASARLRIIRRGTVLVDCNQLSISSTTVGTTRTFTIDISISSIGASCALGTYYSYSSFDSVDLEVNYVYSSNPGGIFRSVVIENEFYFSSVANPTSSSQKYQCDTISGIFQQVGYYLLNYGSGNYTHQGCGELLITQNYYLSVGNCCGNYAGGNLFPFEYRNWAKLSEVKAILPKGYTFSRAAIYHYTTGGSNVVRTQANLPVQLYKQVGDTLFFNIDTLFTDKGGSLILSDDGFYGVLYIYLVPGCEVTPGVSQAVNYSMDFRKMNVLGPGIETITTYDGSNRDFITYNSPDIVITPVNSRVAGNADTISWRLVINNRSNTSQARNVWIAPGILNGLNVLGISDTNNTALTFQNGLYKLGDLNASEQKIIEVFGTFSSCDPDSMRLELGWNCNGYPDSLKSYPCPTRESWLYVIPENTQLQSRIIDTNSVMRLCDPSWYEIEVSNVDLVKAYETGVEITLPYGSEIVSGSSAIRYPVSGSWQNISNPVNVSGTRYRWDATAIAALKNGLPGIADTTKNSFRLKFRLNTDCNFSSGSFFYAQPVGTIKCGRPVISSISIGNPLEIDGVKRPYFANLKVDLDTLETCKQGGFVTVRMLNLGPDTTGTSDLYQITLPDGIIIDTNFYAPLRNAPLFKPSYTSVNGSTIISLQLPSGITPGDSIYFGFRIAPDVSKGLCGPVEFFSQTVVRQPALCVASNTYCDINVATGTDLNLNYISKGDIALQFLDASSTAVAGGEQITLRYTIRNTGAENDSLNYFVVKVFDDADLNHRFSPAENIFKADTLMFSLLKNQTYTRTIQFFAPANSICRLKLLIDSLNCVCNPLTVPFGTIRLLNAGSDTTMCSGDSVNIGSSAISGYTYRWIPSEGVESPFSANSRMTIDYTETGIKDFFYVLETQRGTCSSTDTIKLSVKPGIKLDLAEQITLCKGSEVIIGAVPKGGSGAFTYQWQPVNNLKYPNLTLTQASPDSTTTYTLFVTDFRGCTSKASTKVEVVRPPFPYFYPVQGCEGAELFLRDSIVQYAPVDSIHWDFGDGNEAINTATASHQYGSPGKYPVSLFLRDTNQCISSFTDMAVIYPNPIVTLRDTFACVGDSLRILPSASVSSGNIDALFEWQLDTSFSLSVFYDVHSNVADTLNFIVKAFSDKQCTDTGNFEVIIYPAPAVQFAAGNVCLGEAVSLSERCDSAGLSLVDFTWDLDKGLQAKGRQISHTYSDTGSFTVILVVENDKGCVSSDSQVVQVFSLPVPDFSVGNICLNSSYMVRSLSQSYSGQIDEIIWYCDGTTYTADSFLFQGTDTGNFEISLVLNSDLGCTDSVKKTMRVHALPQPKIQVADVCEGEWLSFEDSQTGNAYVSRRWQLDQDSIHDARIFNHPSPAPGTYRVYLVNTDSNNCSGIDSALVSVHAKPVVDFNLNNPCDDHLILVSESSSAGSGSIQSGQLRNQLGSAWNLPLPDSIALDSGNYNFTLEIQNSYGCRDSLMQSIAAGKRPQLLLESDTFCAGREAKLNASELYLNNGISSRKWSLGDDRTLTNQTQVSISYTSSGSYLVLYEVESTNGCRYDTFVNLTVYPNPQADFSINPPRVNIVNPVVQIRDMSTGAINWRYAMGDGQTETLSDFIYEYGDSGIYQVVQTVTDINGCSDTAMRTVLVDFFNTKYVPDAFSPNNDGLNDIFAPVGRGIHSYELKIYNRWGECLFHSNGNSGWDGTYLGQPVPPGLYTYTLLIYDHKLRETHMSGSLTLIR